MRIIGVGELAAPFWMKYCRVWQYSRCVNKKRHRNLAPCSRRGKSSNAAIWCWSRIALTRSSRRAGISFGRHPGRQAASCSARRAAISPFQRRPVARARIIDRAWIQSLISHRTATKGDDELGFVLQIMRFSQFLGRQTAALTFLLPHISNFYYNMGRQNWRKRYGRTRKRTCGTQKGV